ncbi:MAG: DUF6745 domain-containing protein [Candidatus Thiodiazotropha sp.]
MSSNDLIKRLTPEQEALIPHYLVKWKEIALSTDPADRHLAELGIGLVYESVKFTTPRIIWTTSLKASAVLYRQTFTRNMRGQRIILEGEEGGGRLRNSVYGLQRAASDNIRHRLGAGKQPYVDQVVWEGLNRQLLPIEKIRSHLFSSLGSYKWTWDDLGRKPRSLTSPFDVRPSSCVYGQHDALSLADYDYFREVCGFINETEPLMGHIMIAQAANWWLACKEICIISERPCRLYHDENDQLHREDGPAIEYPDGWGAYYWHGISIAETDQRLRRSSR